MKVIIFGATGMVGQAVLREALADPEVNEVVVVGRQPVGQDSPKLKDVVHKDLSDLDSIEADLTGVDACIFCLGVSAAGMTEEAYRKVTYDLTLGVAKTLRKTSPKCTFVYISGAGTNAKSSTMWARVKGETENALLEAGFPRAYMFRPGYIQPLHGVASKTKLYSAIYFVMSPLYPVLSKVFPKQMVTSEQIGRAMLDAGKRGAPKPILEITDIQDMLK